MEEKEKKKQKQKHSNKSSSEPAFKPSSDVKGLRFGGQFIVKSFTVRRASPLELLRLLALPPPNQYYQNHQRNHNHSKPISTSHSFPSTTAFLPTNFTILAHHAWHTLTLGLGTKKSKVIVFVFESVSLKSGVDRIWPPEIPLGEVNRKLIRGLAGCEMARFKFRKGCITFYVYAVRQVGSTGFSCADDLRTIIEAVVALQDFLDHTAMLALPKQRSINYPPQVAMAH
ncbi:PREDICTED: uncharacterized protein LOC104602462 [Nelumbo nucifera]|uniref:DUF7851 domain-containing protein n=2 Tax=Nelumbo nucifera TaxID=4432 RepID=A0A822Y7G7_NELNU|nr:PREDICTED: uncharacterized protein LOC104602462 [Nelumbo nucifera]DAD28192.1 TPA_asm: hypothetical protein HUJ06_029660 [Nelumbo nucifera]